MDIEKSLRAYPPSKQNIKHVSPISLCLWGERERETEKMAKKTLQLPTSLEIVFASSSEDRASEPEVFNSSEEEEYKYNNKDPFGHG